MDSRGPRISLSIATISLFFGYLGIKLIFDIGNGDSVPLLSLATLMLCNFITGVGGSGGMFGASNAVAKSFPENIVGATLFKRDPILNCFCSVQQLQGLYSQALDSPHSCSL